MLHNNQTSDGRLPANWNRVRLVTARPDFAGSKNSMSEIIELLSISFKKLGCNVDVKDNEFILDGINILFFSFFITDINAIPHNTIIFNSEQINDINTYNLSNMYDQLNKFVFWDYSNRNIDQLIAINNKSNIQYLQIGYAEELFRIEKKEIQDIDILFYGAINDRRLKILNSLLSLNLNVHVTQNCYGGERDNLISRSKIVLNIHYYPSKIFELVRVSYLLNNKICIVSECDEHTEIHENIKNTLVTASYDQIVDTCVKYLSSEELRENTSIIGFNGFKKLDQVIILKKLINDYELLNARTSHS